jgi:hypothetical protein
MQWFGKPVVQNRFLGQVDQDDPTNLPIGLAALCRNRDFTRDAGGPTCANTRAGYNTAIQCLDNIAPVTGAIGFVYSPVSAADTLLTPNGSYVARCQRPLAFQPTQGSQYESPLGTGRMVKFPQTNFTEPQTSGGVMPHTIQASAGNQVFSAYSDLTQPVSGLSTMDPKALTLNPYGMKPFGWNWAPNTPILKGEVCTPSAPLNGNGHTYQAQNSGVTAAAPEPVWPLTESGTVVDNPGPKQVVWKEKTMVIANRVPPPPVPILTLQGAGTIPAAQDVYIVITLTNTAGETLPSTPVLITTVTPGASVQVTLPTRAQLPGWVQNLPPAYVPTGANTYVTWVPTGTPAPALSTYQLFSSAALGSNVIVNLAGTGGAPPTFCSARVTPGQLPTPVVSPAISRSPAGAVVNPPAAPGLILAAGLGTFPSGTTIEVLLTLVNANGETTAGAIATIITTIANQAVRLTLANSYGPTVTGVRVYVNPSSAGAGQFGSVSAGIPPIPYALGATVTITANGNATTPPAANTATLPAGQFPGGRDVYIAQTYTNNVGETPLGPGNAIVNTNPDDAVIVTVSVPLGPNNEQLYSISSVGIYEADVPTGTAAPNPSAYALVGYFQPGDQPFVLSAAIGSNPPINNTTGPGGAIAADTSTGGPNSTQGYRYAACLWINQLGTVSGFTVASVVNTIIDEDGWEIGAFNILVGMPNIVGRIIAFTIADAVQDGPFNYNGLFNIQVPSQNVVYPTRTVVDAVSQSATVILDNVTTQAIFNFTDTYLTSNNNVDDRLDVILPPQGVRIDYLASINRVAITGIPGLASGCYISLAGDYESFYGDNSPVPITTNGERCFGVTDKYKGLPFALMEESGFTISTNTGDPNSWKAERRWDGMGPCGFRAWDANGKMITFAHRSGLYKYDESDPDMMQKEVPRLWSTINWNAASCISVTIDEDTHTVRVLVPTGASTVPNEDFTLSYIEGWNNPIHFSTFSGKEISMDAARRWSPHDVAGFVCLRMKRMLPPDGNAYLDGPSWNTLPDSSFQLTQLLYASSGPDGTLQARTPGIFSDNGAGIDDTYETMSSGLMQAVCKPEGMNLNACGNGQLLTSFIASRDAVTDEGGEQKLIQELDELVMDPIDLTPVQTAGITRKCAPSVNEFWRVRLSNGKVPGSWNSLKAMTTYMIPVTVGRDPGDS